MEEVQFHRIKLTLVGFPFQYTPVLLCSTCPFDAFHVFIPWGNNAVNQSRHAVEESWQANGNQRLGPNIEMHLNFFPSSFSRVRSHTPVRTNTNPHSRWRTRHNIFRAHTELQVLIYIQLEMSIYSSCNLSILLLIPTCVYVRRFESDSVHHGSLVWKSWNPYVPVWAGGFVCLGYWAADSH